MASIIEELIEVLEKEDKIYQELIPISEKKTRIIIDNNLQDLQKVTESEQGYIEKILCLEKKREEIVKNIGIVLSKDPEGLDLKTIISLLSGQPLEHKKLSQIHDKMGISIQRMVEVNSRNKMLIQESLEMIEFNMSLINNSRTLPGSNTYTRGASENQAPSLGTGAFDTKQ